MSRYSRRLRQDALCIECGQDVAVSQHLCGECLLLQEWTQEQEQVERLRMAAEVAADAETCIFLPRGIEPTVIQQSGASSPRRLRVVSA
jgi:hypothetical protein